MIGVDFRGADVDADLGTATGRHEAIGRIAELCDGALDGLVTSAGLAGLPDRPTSPLLISVNYFGTVELLAGLRDVLTATEPTTVAITDTTTTQPRDPHRTRRRVSHGRRGRGPGTGRRGANR